VFLEASIDLVAVLSMTTDLAKSKELGIDRAYLLYDRSLSRCCRPIYFHLRIELASLRAVPTFHQPYSHGRTYSISPTVFAPYSVAIALPSFPPRYLIFRQPALGKWGRTSVKSILRRKAAVADFRRIV
jgi:hypothetical protein